MCDSLSLSPSLSGAVLVGAVLAALSVPARCSALLWRVCLRSRERSERHARADTATSGGDLCPLLALQRARAHEQYTRGVLVVRVHRAHSLFVS